MERIFALLSAFSRNVNVVILGKFNFKYLFTTLKLLEQYALRT